MFSTDRKQLCNCRGWTILAVSALGVMMAGCASDEKLYREVSLSNDAAYQQWKNRKELKQQSETQIAGQLSLKDCLKLTLKNNKTIQSLAQEKEYARGEKLGSYSAILPDVDITGDYTKRDELGAYADYDNYEATLKVTQPVFAGGAIIAELNAGKLFALVTDKTVQTALQNVIYTSKHTYYDVLLNQHLYKISTDAVRSAKAHLDDVKLKRTGGVASDFDVLRAEVELSNFKAELIQNKNAINISKIQLLKTMGISQDSNFTLSDKLTYQPSKISMENAVEIAFKNRPELSGARFDIRYKKEQLNIARSKYWPVVDAYYKNTWAKPDPHNTDEMQWGKQWRSGVTITFPFFDGFAREGEIIQKKARLRQSQIDLIDTEETTLFELNKAILNIENAEELVLSQQLNFSRAEEGSRLAKVGYKEGINTQVEVIDAESALTKAKSLYYQAIYSHIIAELDLQKAMGVLDLKLNNDNAPGEQK